MPFIEATEKGVVLNVRLQPRAARNEVAGVIGDSLKIRVTAPPAEGAANEACRDFLAKLFGIAKGSVHVVSGSKSRQKKVLLSGVQTDAAASLIRDLLREHPQKTER